MFPRSIKIIVVALIAAAACARAAHAQSVRNGAVSGTLVSASGVANANVLTVPPGKTFVLTQFCSEDGRAFKLTVDNFGTIPAQNSVTPCNEYHPGVAIPGPATITCLPTSTNFPLGTNCLITGVLTAGK